MKNKKIGFDIHGVIDTNPELFSKIIKRFREMNYEIHILTGSLPSDILFDELESYGIIYDKFFSILGHHKLINTHMWEDKRGCWINDGIWNTTKSEYCNYNNIDFHLDDTRVYGKNFNNGFGHLSPVSDVPRKLEIYGDVDHEILEVFNELSEGYYTFVFK